MRYAFTNFNTAIIGQISVHVFASAIKAQYLRPLYLLLGMLVIVLGLDTIM